MPDSRQPSPNSRPSPIDTRNAVYSGYYRNLPHWRLDGATYFVTWRVHPDQPELNANERSETVLTMRHFDSQRFHLLAWVVMNNHVHALVQPCKEYELAEIVHSWKSYSTNRLQQRFGRKGAVWHREYFDRVVRDENEFEQKLHYRIKQPIKTLARDRRVPMGWRASAPGSTPARRPELLIGVYSTTDISTTGVPAG